MISPESESPQPQFGFAYLLSSLNAIEVPSP